MAPNDRQSRAGTRIASTEGLPWWVWPVLAAFSYFALHAMALRPYAIVVDPGDVGAALAAFLVAGAAESLQYVLPALCVSVLIARLAPLPAEALGPEWARSHAAVADNAMTTWEFERLTSGGLRLARRPRKRSAARA